MADYPPESRVLAGTTYAGGTMHGTVVVNIATVDIEYDGQPAPARVLEGTVYDDGNATGTFQLDTTIPALLSEASINDVADAILAALNGITFYGVTRE